MNIKNPEARQLARELSEITGESVTEAVTTALRERLEEIVVTELSDTALAWELGADGTWSRVADPHDAHSVNAQRVMYERALERAQRP